MLYLIMGLMAVIPIIMLVSALIQLKKEDQKDSVRYQFDLVQKYSAHRTRGSVRQGMGLIKNVEDYYIIEKNISFPKK